MISEYLVVYACSDGFMIEQVDSCAYRKAQGATPREAIDSAMQLHEEGRENER